MKHILTYLALLAGGVSAFSQSMTGDLTAVDTTLARISVSAGGGTPRDYRVRPGAEVLINGSKAKFADLTEGMTVKIVSAETGLATRIEAAGTPKGGAAGAETASLEKRLIGTKWLWYETKGKFETMTFAPGGKAWWSIKHRGDFTWSVTPDGKRIEGIAPPNSRKFKMTFDATLTKGKIYEGDDRARDTKLVQ